MYPNYSDLVGKWELFNSEVPGLVDGSEIYYFTPEQILWVEINDGKKKHRQHFNVEPRFDGLNLLRTDGTTFVRWHLEWQGQVLLLSHNLHCFRSLLRRINPK
jgi:hypothetical protein